MALVPHKITALAESDAEGTDGKNIIANAIVSLYDADGNAATLYDNEEGGNGSTAKQTDSTGQVVVFVEPGEYSEEVNGSVRRKVAVGLKNMTTSDLIASRKFSRVGSTINTTGFSLDGDGGGAQWEATATVGLTPSQKPVDRGQAQIVDATGRLWTLVNEDVNPFMLGAVGDGVEDDTDVLQICINEKNLILPDSSFGYTSLSIPRGAFIRGAGTEKSRLVCLSQDAGNTIEIDGQSKWTIRDFGIYGNNPSGTDTGQNGLVVTDSSSSSADYNTREWTIDNVLIDSFGGTGLLIEKAISPGNAWGRTGNILAVKIRACYRGAWFLDRGEYITVTGMHVWECARGLELKAGNVKFIGCQFDDNANGAILNSGINDHHGAFSSCSFNHNSNYDLWIQSSTKGQSFDDCSFFDGILRIDSSKGITFNGGNLAVSAIELNNNTGSITFSNMLIREDSSNELVLSGSNEYQFINCRDRNGFFSGNTHDVTYNSVVRTADLPNSAAERTVSWTSYAAAITGGNDAGGKISSNKYPIFESGFYSVSFSCDYGITGASQAGEQACKIVRDREGSTDVIASSPMATKAGGASGSVSCTVYLESGDEVSTRITDTNPTDGTRAIKASEETYFNVVLLTRAVTLN